jgi:hypothetical protein
VTVGGHPVVPLVLPGNKAAPPIAITAKMKCSKRLPQTGTRFVAVWGSLQAAALLSDVHLAAAAAQHKTRFRGTRVVILYRLHTWFCLTSITMPAADSPREPAPKGLHLWTAAAPSGQRVTILLEELGMSSAVELHTVGASWVLAGTAVAAASSLLAAA